MIVMSYYEGTFDKESASNLISNTNKLIYHKHGYYIQGKFIKEQVNKEEALRIIEECSLMDIHETSEEIVLDIYSELDTW